MSSFTWELMICFYQIVLNIFFINLNIGRKGILNHKKEDPKKRKALVFKQRV